MAVVHTTLHHHRPHDRLRRHRWPATSHRRHECAPAPLLLQLDHCGSARQHIDEQNIRFPRATVPHWLRYHVQCGTELGNPDDLCWTTRIKLKTSCVEYLAETKHPVSPSYNPTVIHGRMPLHSLWDVAREPECFVFEHNNE